MVGYFYIFIYKYEFVSYFCGIFRQFETSSVRKKLIQLMVFSQTKDLKRNGKRSSLIISQIKKGRQDPKPSV